MVMLEDLLSELTDCDTKSDLAGLRRVREQIVLEHPQSEAAVEASYKIGLDLLFRERQRELAMEHFELAAKRRVPFWSDAARTSLGLCLFHQRRTQKALLELRRVAYQDKPNAHSITALSFIETIYESEGNQDEVKRARKDRVTQLEALCKPGGGATSSERGYFLYLLGLAYRDQGLGEKGTRALEEAKALGPEALGADLYRSVCEALH